jgi:hypothetical protein
LRRRRHQPRQAGVVCSTTGAKTSTLNVCDDVDTAVNQNTMRRTFRVGFTAEVEPVQASVGELRGGGGAEENP